MKKTLSLTLAAILAASAVSCAAPAPARSAAASDAFDPAAFLSARVADTSDIILGGADEAASLGIDMTAFEDEGYTIRRIDGQTAILAKTDGGLDRAVRDFVKHQSDPAYEVTVGEGYRIKRLTVCGNDIADYVIVLPPEGERGKYHESTEYAADELSRFIEKACGVSLEITTDRPADGKCFELIPDNAEGELGEDGFDTSVSGGTVTFRGGFVRGCLYGVYDFLEDVIGWRFYTGLETYLYPADSLDVPDGYENREIPRFDLRNVRDYARNYKNVTSSMTNDAFAARRKCNCFGAGEDARVGYAPIRPASHDLASLTETSWESQPCFFDDDIFDTAMANITARLEKAEAAGQIGNDLKQIGVGQNDNNYFCICRQCHAQVAKTGSEAGCTLYFANRIAEALEDTFPTVYICIYAYWGAIIPPKRIEAHPMVAVCYVLYGFCWHHSMSGDDCDPYVTYQEGLNNIVHKKQIAEWGKLVDKLALYPYGVDFWQGLSPYMNLDDYPASYRYFASCDIYGVTCENGLSQLCFDELSIYMMELLSWDPYMSDEEYDAKMCEFMEYLYGDGWDCLYQYLIEICREKDKLPCDEDDPFDWYAENYDRLVSLFGEAMEQCNSTEQYERIERLSYHMHWGALCGMYESRFVNGTDSDRAFLQSIADMIRDGMVKYNIDYWGLAASKLTSDTNYDLSEEDPHRWM